jgi:hypothetical protein
MMTSAASARSLLFRAGLCLLAAQPYTAAQTAAAPQAVPTNGYRVAGSVVSKTDGHALARARVTLRDTKNSQKFESRVTEEDGKFYFPGVPMGKYSLTGRKRGFIAAAYDQHEQFSTAIVTDAGIDTEALVLRLAPAGVISGKILDESGDPVRHASVTLYSQDHSSGVDQIHQARGGQTDDQGEYELPSLAPGTYFLSANAKPWYAIHPSTEQRGSRSNHKSPPDPPENFDHSVDVAYPLTYYSDVTDTDSATPISIHGGEHLQVDIHLNPVPSLHILFHLPTTGNQGYSVPQLEQPSFDGSAPLRADSTHMISPGFLELTGVPAGRYNIRVSQAGGSVEMNGVDVTKDREEISISNAEPTSTVKLSVQVAGASKLPEQLMVSLHSPGRAVAGLRPLDAKGEAELPEIAAGRYQVAVWGNPRLYSIKQISAEGATISGHTLVLPAGASASVSLTVVAGSSNLEGNVKRAGKLFAGAMVVLVPRNFQKDPEANRDLFRRDQSDLDGTFSLPNIVPGSYTLLAIENGWDLDWSQPTAIAPYLPRGRAIEIGAAAGQTMRVAEAVEVQEK